MTTSSLTAAQRDSLLNKLQQQFVELGGELLSEREDARDSVDSLHDVGVYDKGEESAAASVMAVDRAIPQLRERLLDELGWKRDGAGPGMDAAVSLYFSSGHGAMFKKQLTDVFVPYKLEAQASG